MGAGSGDLIQPRKSRSLMERLGGGLPKDALRLLVGQGISTGGTRATMVVLPLLLVTLMQASATQVALVIALDTVPFLVVGLVAGAWADRYSGRLIMMVADATRAALVLSVPIAYWMGSLHIAQVYVVAALVGTLSVFSDAAFEPFVTSLISEEQQPTVATGSYLAMALAEMFGPSLAGGLVQAFAAPLAMVADASSYVASWLLLRPIREPEKERKENKLFDDIKEGLRFIASEMLLIRITASIATINLTGSWLMTVFFVFASRQLGLSAVLIGVVFSMGGVSLLVGLKVSDWLVERYGESGACVIGLSIAGVGSFALWLAVGPTWVAMTVLLVGQFLAGLGQMIFMTQQRAVRWTLTPKEMRGRTSATIQVVYRGVVPFGAVLGGAAAGVAGPRLAMMLGGVVALTAVWWVAASPLSPMREVPTQEQ